MHSVPRRFRLCTAILAALLGCAAYPAQAGTLTQAVLAAMNNHPAVEAAQANADAVSQEETQQFSNFMPKVSMRAAGGRVYGDNATSRGLSVTRGAGYSGYGEGSVSLTEMIYDNEQTWNRVKGAKDRKASAEFGLTDARQELALKAVLAYLDLLRGQESLKYMDDHQALLEDYIKRIKGMVKEGAAEESMAVQARDILEQLNRTRSETIGRLDEARADYFEVTGVEPVMPLTKPVPKLNLIPDKIGSAIDYANDHHPAFQAAHLKAQGLKHDSEAEKAALYPTLNSELSYRKVDQRDIIGGEVTDARALLSVNWDYSLGGAELAKIKEAKQRAKEAEAQRDQQGRQIVNGIRKSYYRLRTAQEQLDISQDRQELNETLLKNNKAQFEGARMNILQVLQAENGLFNARLGLLNDQYRLMASQYAVLASMGRLLESLNIRLASDDGHKP